LVKQNLIGHIIFVLIVTDDCVDCHSQLKYHKTIIVWLQ